MSKLPFEPIVVPLNADKPNIDFDVEGYTINDVIRHTPEGYVSIYYAMPDYVEGRVIDLANAIKYHDDEDFTEQFADFDETYPEHMREEFSNWLHEYARSSLIAGLSSTGDGQKKREFENANLLYHMIEPVVETMIQTWIPDVIVNCDEANIGENIYTNIIYPRIVATFIRHARPDNIIDQVLSTNSPVARNLLGGDKARDWYRK